MKGDQVLLSSRLVALMTRNGKSAVKILTITAPAGQDFLTWAWGLRQQERLSYDESWLHENARQTSKPAMKDSDNKPPSPLRYPDLLALGSWMVSLWCRIIGT